VLYKARRKFLYPASGFAFRALPCIAFFEEFFHHAQDVYVAQQSPNGVIDESQRHFADKPFDDNVWREAFQEINKKIDVLGQNKCNEAFGMPGKSLFYNLLMPNRNLHIAGSKIKIAGDNGANGVYFVNQTTQAFTKVDPLDIVTNNPSELIIVIPALVAGTYKVEVTTQYTPSKLLNEPHTSVFDTVLTVQGG
jgi:hypothetical protein